MKTRTKSQQARGNAWLSEISKDDSLQNYSSQRGEDRILHTIFDMIGVGEKWCVEFGAADGKRGSNTWQFINKQGWSGVQIEPKHDRDLMLKQKRDTYEALVERYGGNDRVQCMDTQIGYGPNDSLDVVLGKTATPIEFDLLSIDIDGEDYRVWQALLKYKPRVVVVEHNKCIPIEVDFASSEGSSLRAFTRLANEKGYELVAATMVNGIFVQREFYDTFEIADNDPAVIWPDSRAYQQYVWQQYDGTVIVQGRDKVRWVRSVDGTISGQLASGKFKHIGEKGELWSSSKELGGVRRPLFSGRLRQAVYSILDRL